MPLIWKDYFKSHNWKLKPDAPTILVDVSAVFKSHNWKLKPAKLVKEKDNETTLNPTIGS